MPGMDGFETLEEIRKESSLPILMFTSKNDSASKVRGLRAGADDYLTKPFDKLIMIICFPALWTMAIFFFCCRYWLLLQLLCSLQKQIMTL